MIPIRLLTSIAGGPVEGAAGDVVHVDPRTAAVWADGERAERVGEPAGEKNVAPPAGERATTAPGGERAVRPPAGERAAKRRP